MLLLLDKDTISRSIFSQRNISILIILIAFGLLLLTKSRTTLLSLIAALLFHADRGLSIRGAWMILTGLVSCGSFLDC